MNQFKEFMFNGNRVKVALSTFLVTSVFMTLLFIGIDLIGGKELSIFRTIVVVSTMSFMWTGVIMHVLKTGKDSEKFWTFAKQVEAEIKNAKTAHELKQVYEGDFAELNIMSLGGPHRHEILRLLTIMDTKVQYLK